MLNELEPVRDAALIASEHQSTTMVCLLISLLFLGHLRAELNSTTHDAVSLGRESEALKVGTGKRLADVCCERAELLEVQLRREMEIIVSKRKKNMTSEYATTKEPLASPLRISTELRVIFKR